MNYSNVFNEIRYCRPDEKLKLLESIDMLLNYSRKVACSGILSLEKELKTAENRLLKKALQMMIDGVEPELLKQILWNYICCSCYKPAEILQGILFLEGVSAIQGGMEEDLMREKLVSFLGEDFIGMTEEHYGLSDEMLKQKRDNYLLELEGNKGNDSSFEKTIEKMNERSLQRLLREMDRRTLTEAIYGLNRSSMEKVLRNVSVRVASKLIEGLESGYGVNQRISEGARDYMIEVMHQLIESKDIAI